MAAYPPLRSVEYHNEFGDISIYKFDIRQYFNGKNIRRILKLYSLFSSQNEILEQTAY